ncbi:MAG: DNA-binding LacI/PurR family transcriptional regulator [Flavobacteriales bacterium]
MIPVISMDDIAKLACVSKATVSRVLSGSTLVAQPMRDHVLKVAGEAGYVVNRQARQFRGRAASAVAVACNLQSFDGTSTSDLIMRDVLSGVCAALASCGKETLLVSAPSNGVTGYFQELISSGGAEGLIFLQYGQSGKLLEGLARAGVPLVAWGAANNGNTFSTVGSDGFTGGQLAGRYFIKHHRRNIVFVGNARDKEVHALRAGLQDIVAKSELVAIRDLMIKSENAEDGFMAATRLLNSGLPLPDGVLAQSDTVAMAFLSAFRDAGVSAPKDFNVIGFGDIEVSQYFNPPLTTIYQDSELIGRMLVEKLQDAIMGELPNPTALTVTLIDRGS